jgi:hypothetical protein
MANSYSDLKFEIIEVGGNDGTWGPIVNTNVGTAIEQAIVGMATLETADFSSNVITLPFANTNAAQNFRAFCLNITATLTGAGTVNVPAIQKPYLVLNNSVGGFAVTVKVTGLTGVSIPNGKGCLVYNNGTDVKEAITHLTSLTLASPLAITSGGTGSASTTFVNLTSNVTGTLPVANGGTGTTTPALVQGSNITITGTWPNQTIAAATAPGQVYPGAGIANSTGSAWGTSYTTTGSGTVIALATSPTLITPVLGTPSSGILSACTVDGTDGLGFRNIPINSQNTNYTLVLADAGKSIFHPSTDSNDRTFTIPANASVAYPLGTAVSFINMSVNAVVIAINSDTMYFSGSGETGSRTLAQYGSATAIKMTSTTWMISGSNLS